MIEYTAGFAFDADRKVLLIQKARPAWQAGKLNGIGGKAKEGETPSETQVREFEEETGLLTSQEDWETFAILIGENTDNAGKWKVSFMRAFNIPIDKAQPIEDEVPIVVDPGALPSTVIGNLHWLIPMALDLDLQTPTYVQYK
jgi:8-oxo-dGTP diphosphatase